MAMVVKPARQQITELLGSLLTSALVVAVMCVAMMLIYSHDSAIWRPERVAWLLLVSLAGAWAILVPAKVWEAAADEPSLRRFVSAVAGLAVGALACVVADALMVDLPSSRQGGPAIIHLLDQIQQIQRDAGFYPANGRPLMIAYVATFGTFFLLMRWWRQTDPLRRARLRLLPLIVSAAVAYLVAELWHFPQPWLPMVAATISMSVQLASPWMCPRGRLRQENPQ